jgi:hypothetical protein
MLYHATFVTTTPPNTGSGGLEQTYDKSVRGVIGVL